MQADKGDRSNGNQNSCQHDDNEPGGAIGGLFSGLGDAHGVDEEIGDELERIHRALYEVAGKG